jgi:hypothetical protein
LLSGSAVKVKDSNLYIPLLAMVDVVPDNTGVYVVPAVEDVTEMVAVELPSDPTY